MTRDLLPPHTCTYESGSVFACHCLLAADHQENDVEQFWNGDET